MNNTHNPGRRNFLRRLGLTTGALGTLTLQDKFQLMSTALAAPVDDLSTGYRSLVCVFLGGGSDTWNMMVPTGSAAYNKYAAVRQNLAIARESLLPVSGAAGFGFHPATPGLRRLYDDRKLAVMANVGNLFEPLTQNQIFTAMAGGNPGVAIPPELFSHSHQTETCQTALPSLPGVSAEGWGGRMADLIANNGGASFSPSLTLAGSNFWLAARAANAYGVRPLFDGNGEFLIDDFNHFNDASWPDWAVSRSNAWRQIQALSRGHPLEAHAAASYRGAKENADRLRVALAGAANIETPYDTNNPLAVQLRAAARLIAVREILGTPRQVIYVSLGGWDTHSAHLQDHANQSAQLSDALESFYRTTVELGVADTTTTFTATEFGRTFTSNGDGTDHAWAADFMVMGGSVDGGKVHGTPIQYSDVPIGEHQGEKLFGPADVGSGRFIPRYSIDQYGATLARWLGFSDVELSHLFPNLNNFTQKDLGFML